MPGISKDINLKITPTNTGMHTFLIIWSGELISILGSGLTRFALGVWVYTQTGQATPFALTVLFGTLPRILLMPVAGSLADRRSRRWLMILSDGGCALVTLATAILLFFGSLNIGYVYLFSFFSAAFSAFQEPAYMASITMLVPKNHLVRANGMIQMGEAISNIATPLLAGLLFISIGLRGILLIDFATFFFAVTALLIVRIPQPKMDKPTGTQKSPILSDLAFGWSYLRLRSGLLGLLLFYAVVNFLLNFSGVLLGPLVLSRFPASTYGVIETVMGVGILAGSIAISSWGGPKKRRIPFVITIIALSMIGYIITGLRPSSIFPAVGMFIVLFLLPFCSGTSEAVWQTKVEPEVQGRVFSLRSMISQSMMPLAYISAGPLTDYVFEPLMGKGGALAGTAIGAWLGSGTGRGIGFMFVISGIVGIIISVIVYANPRIRCLEEEIPDAVPNSTQKP
jgi:MFS transporter, DHA3 family, macrolide efflux protein